MGRVGEREREREEKFLGKGIVHLLPCAGMFDFSCTPVVCVCACDKHCVTRKKKNLFVRDATFGAGCESSALRKACASVHLDDTQHTHTHIL